MNTIYSVIRRMIFVFTAFWSIFSAQAQMPFIKTEGKESHAVYLQDLTIDVAISGALATTTWTMTFRNSTNRILEGQLDFPLPEGIDVSRYALDINGKLREAVPVEKTKGTQVFEQVEHRRVDPGLLEKVDGNSFRTRIYPINAKSTRTVVIAYEQPLAAEGNKALLYHLPLAFDHPLEAVSIDCRVDRNSEKPAIEENIDDELSFGRWQESWSAKQQWTNKLLDKPLTIRIPVRPDAAMVQMQEKGGRYYYAINSHPSHPRIETPRPQKLTLFWDVSLSGLRRDIKKELQFLDTYFTHLKNVEVELVPFSNTVRGEQHFVVRGGDWTELKNVLNGLVYDGGTQLGVLDCRKYPCDQYLLVSDGRSNFGSSQVRLAGGPVYAVVSGAGGDFSSLRRMTSQSGGELINLGTTGVKEAVEQLMYQQLYFMGVQPQAGLEESYPSLPVAVQGGVAVSGILDRQTADEVLQFGYGGKVTSTMKVHLDYDAQKTVLADLSRTWAQQKIAELDQRYEENRDEITRLGKRFGIVTRNTSLIVLEFVQDYIAYEIEPPAELRPEYDALMKGRGQPLVSAPRVALDNAQNIAWELQKWWGMAVPEDANRNTTVKFGEPISVPDARDDSTGTALRSGVPVGAAAGASAGAVLTGRAAGVQVQGRTAGVNAQGRTTGVNAQGRTVGMDAQGNVQSNALNEVVVVGYATTRKREMSANVATVNADEFDGDGTRGIYRDAAIVSDTIFRAGHPAGGNFRSYKPESKTAWIEMLRKAAPKERYAAYLKEREKNMNTPLFYFNTAEFFFDAGDRELGLRILSNIAELDVQSYELYKMMGYQLRKTGDTAEACAVFRKVLEWRPFEPQSYRDYALALEDAGRYQTALDTFYAGLVKNYSAYTQGLYPGIEEIFLPEIASLVALHGGGLDMSKYPKSLLTNLPVDIRVVLNWNMSDTDMDLWVTDPNGEKCYYSHRTTEIGGRISRDFTQGLGPEQFLLKHAVKGAYKVEANYYGDRQVRLAGATSLLLEIYTYYGTERQTRTLIPLQMQSTDTRTVQIGSFNF